MKDLQLEYVTADQAKKLKKLGFDSWCDATWTEYKKTTDYNQKGWRFEERGVLKGTNSIHSQDNSKYYEIFSAPTIALALKWVRTNQKIDVNFYARSWGSEDFRWSIGFSFLEDKMWGVDLGGRDADNPYETKEMAETAGLDLALDYIIKKEKKKKIG